jgi:hypothetical protein
MPTGVDSVPRPVKPPIPVSSAVRKLIGVDLRKDDPNPPRSRITGRDTRLSEGRGCRVRGSSGTCEQQQSGTIRITAKNITAGDFWLIKPRSPVFVFRPLVSELLVTR